MKSKKDKENEETNMVKHWPYMGNLGEQRLGKLYYWNFSIDVKLFQNNKLKAKIEKVFLHEITSTEQN